MDRAARYLQTILRAAALGLLLWLAARFVLPLLAPFALAFALAALTEGAVCALARRGLPRRAAAALMTLALFASLCLLPVLLAAEALPLLSGLIRGAPGLVAAIEERLDALEALLARCAAALPEGISERFRMSLASAEGALNTLPASLSAKLLSFAARTAQNCPEALLFLVTLFLGTYFMSASYGAVTAFLAAQLPPALRRRAGEIAADLRADLGGWLRAQLILCAITFFELLALFLLLGVRGAPLVAALTALIDALPVFGTGAVLVPWALAQLLLGRGGRALALLAGWAVTALGRNLLQARLLGDQIGLEPLVSLLALYVGWRVWGVWGMIVCPLLFASLVRLVDRGVIRLWNSA